MIELKDVTIKRPSFTFGPVSQRFDDGRIYMVMGENGAGKTTLLDILSGMIIPDEGVVYKDVRISYAPQESDNAFFLPTVLDEFSYTLREKRKDEVEKRSEQLLSLIGLSSAYIQRSPFSLSGGEKRLLSIALALAVNPDFLLLDESISGLDYKGYKALRALLRALKAEGRGVVFITHELDILDLADILIVIKGGKIIFCGTPLDAMEKGYVEKSFSYMKSMELIGTPILSLKEIARRVSNE
ncbi:MAG TPA: ABC transporter ATP-binding protein [Candidatus Ornithospirochaeta stercorigallinarum]|nr:ABC transporter ATP-binding protein [Candidatus Ornithospirochaeta stercorigallinarum]